MHVALNPQFDLTLNREELRLIGLGLSGKLKDKRDIEAAKTLNLKLLEMAQHELSLALNVYAGALKKAQEEAASGT